jgi:hypothetical protein
LACHLDHAPCGRGAQHPQPFAHIGEEFVSHHLSVQGGVEAGCMIEIEAEGSDYPLCEIDQLFVAGNSISRMSLGSS